MEEIAGGTGPVTVAMTEEERKVFTDVLVQLQRIEADLVSHLVQYEKSKSQLLAAHEELQGKLKQQAEVVVKAHDLSTEFQWKIDFAAGTIERA